MRFFAFPLFTVLMLTGVMARAEGNARPQAVDSAFWSWQPLTAQGQSVDLGSFRGRYVLLNFWGEWCLKCREEIPFLSKLRQRYGENRLVILGLLKTYDLPRARTWIADNKMDWPQLLLTDRMEKYFAVQKFPTNLLLSPDGKIVMDGFSHHYRDFVRRLAGTDSLEIR